MARKALVLEWLRISIYRTVKFSVYRFHDSFHVSDDIVVPKAENAISFCAEPPCAPFIFVNILVEAVLRAVDLDHELRRHAGKIHYVGPNRHLASKVRSFEHELTKLTPKTAFRIRCVGPQPVCRA